MKISNKILNFFYNVYFHETLDFFNMSKFYPEDGYSSNIKPSSTFYRFYWYRTLSYTDLESLLLFVVQ